MGGVHARVLATCLTQRTESLCHRVQILGSGQIRRRLAMLLIRMAESEGISRTDGVRIPTPLSRRDMADLCGTSVETTARIMARWEREGVVVRAARGLLCRLNALVEIATSGEFRR